MNYKPKGKEKDLVGNILGLFVSKVAVDSISLDEGGVIGDKFYNRDINRSVLISTIESYQLARAKGIELVLGALGENIVMDYNPYSLPQGSKIGIGDNLILEISQYCTLCKSLTRIDNRLPKLLKNDRGIFAKVIKSGDIKLGDKIYIF